MEIINRNNRDFQKKYISGFLNFGFSSLVEILKLGIKILFYIIEIEIENFLI